MKLENIDIKDAADLVEMEKQGYRWVHLLIEKDEDTGAHLSYSVLSRHKREGPARQARDRAMKGGVVLPLDALLLTFGSSVRGDQP